MRKHVPALFLAALLLLVWEGYCRLSGISTLVLPSPSGVGAALVRNWSEISGHMMSTMRIVALGFSVSVIFAFSISVVLHFSSWAQRGLMPLFVASQTVPLVALAPLVVLWFGFGLLPKVLLVVLVTFLPMLMSLLSGYRQVPASYRDLLVSMGAGPMTVFRRATLPAARASFLAGLRISATYAVVAAIFAEYAGARQGLGIYILAAKNNFRADLVLAAVVVSAGMTLGLLGVLRFVAWVTRRGAGDA